MKRTPLQRKTPMRRTSAMPARSSWINKVSSRTADRNRAYSRERDVFLSFHARCQVGWDGCRGAAELVHHSRGRVGAFLLDQSTWVAACDPCHRAVHAHSDRARAEGFMGSRI